MEFSNLHVRIVLCRWVIHVAYKARDGNINRSFQSYLIIGKKQLWLTDGCLQNTGHWQKSIELLTYALSGVNIIFLPGKEPKYRAVLLNTELLATVQSIS